MTSRWALVCAADPDGTAKASLAGGKRRRDIDTGAAEVPSASTSDVMPAVEHTTEPCLDAGQAAGLSLLVDDEELGGIDPDEGEPAFEEHPPPGPLLALANALPSAFIAKSPTSMVSDSAGGHDVPAAMFLDTRMVRRAEGLLHVHDPHHTPPPTFACRRYRTKRRPHGRPQRNLALSVRTRGGILHAHRLILLRKPQPCVQTLPLHTWRTPTSGPLLVLPVRQCRTCYCGTQPMRHPLRHPKSWQTPSRGANRLRRHHRR